MTTVREYHGMACPVCGDDQRLDIGAFVWVRLKPDGTDVQEARNGDHQWSSHSAAACHTCGFGGYVHDLEEAGRRS